MKGGEEKSQVHEIEWLWNSKFFQWIPKCRTLATHEMISGVKTYQMAFALERTCFLFSINVSDDIKEKASVFIYLFIYLLPFVPYVIFMCMFIYMPHTHTHN